MRIEAAIELPAELFVASDVLGASFNAIVGGLNVTTTFPIADPSPRDPRIPWFAIAPGSDGHRVAATGEWGHEYSDDVWNVLKVRCDFEIPDGVPPGDAPETKTLQDCFHIWFDLLREWIYAAHRLPLRRGRLRQTASVGGVLGGVPWGSRSVPGGIFVAGPGLAGGTRVELEAACLRASANDRAPIEHLLLLDASSANSEGDRRRSVIDACTAAEVALAAFTRGALWDLGVPQDAIETITRRANGIAALFDLATSLNLRTAISANTLRSQLASQRNRAAHAGGTPTADETVEAQRVARAIVERASPLAFP